MKTPTSSFTAAFVPYWIRTHSQLSAPLKNKENTEIPPTDVSVWNRGLSFIPHIKLKMSLCLWAPQFSGGGGERKANNSFQHLNSFFFFCDSSHRWEVKEFQKSKQELRVHRRLGAHSFQGSQNLEACPSFKENKAPNTWVVWKQEDEPCEEEEEGSSSWERPQRALH